MKKLLILFFVTFFAVSFASAKQTYNVKVKAIFYNFLDKTIQVNGKCLKEKIEKRYRSQKRCYRTRGKRQCRITKHRLRDKKICTLYEKLSKTTKVLEEEPQKGYFYKEKKKNMACYFYLNY